MSDHSDSNLFSSAIVNHLSPPIEDSVIDSLIAAESHHSPPPDYLLRCRRGTVHVTHRQDSINWILNAYSHYQFHPITAILSVNYFDRFLSSASPKWDNGWKFQLLSVACFSLAAKMEEPEVPLLLDLQVSEPRFVFEPKSIQRMELWIMEKLNWRLRSVTPFDFLHYYISKLPQSSSSSTNQLHFYSKCSDLIIKTIRVIDFLGFRPSVIAAATVVSAAGGGVEIPESYYEKVDKEMVRSCHQLMEEYLVDTCPSVDHKVRKERRSDEEAPPASPDGVLDAATCVSCDTRSDDRNLVRVLVSGEGDREVKRVRVTVQEDVLP